MSLFPLISEADDGTELETGNLPLYREVAWDFDSNAPVWRDGNPLYVTGAAAVLVWAWNAIHTPRLAHDVFSQDYGQDLSALIGQPYTEEIRQSEAIRCLRETLTVNPYITAVDQISVLFDGSTLYLSCRITTIYGEVTIDGADIAV